ncbi:zinc-binding dehydrogenase [Alkalicoccus chagannorensis]|uniref:zinc-binding dehydrogenase n=1 Tax=Alkalicoccus chagannorensis TaxID=427072 RepID=UPI000410D1A0|nr:zinc-binding dehydrogenase [Alkalicoccus chagannorensis]
MKALVDRGGGSLDALELSDMPVPEPEDNEIRIKVVQAGLNHRDLFIPHRNKGNKEPVIPGSDGAGIVDACGGDVEAFQPGDEVIINPGLGWEENTPAPPDSFHLLGYPGHGTFAEYVTVPAAHVELKPPHLSWEEAGVLSLAALTAFRALFTKGRLQSSDTVFIPGAGSGTAGFLIPFAKKTGAEVFTSSRSKEKRRRALALGADAAVDSSGNWQDELEGRQADLIIDAVGAATFQKSMDLLKKGGRMVIFGSSTGDTVDFHLRSFFYGQYELIGSTMGSHEEFHQMLAFVSKHNIRPGLDSTVPLEQIKEALQRLEDGLQFGKISITVSEEV